jgi:DNA-binding NtrC family response regulator
VIIIKVPPLNQRVEDIPALIEKFLSDLSIETGAKKKDVTEEALKLLQKNQWTGNIRELRNVIERLVIMSGPTIELKDVQKYL